MGGERSESAGERPKFFTPGMIAVLSLLVLVVLFFFLRLALVASARRALERELAAARASGYPTTPEELAPPAVPEEENAAPMLETAAAMIGWTDEERQILAWSNSFGYAVSEDDMKAALDRHAEALELAREAFRRPHYRFGRDYSEPAFDVPNLRGSEILTRLLLTDSLLKAREGKRQESVEALFQALDVSARIGSDPMLISKMMSVAMSYAALFAIEQMNREGLLDDDMRRAILERLGRGDIPARLETVFFDQLAFFRTRAEDFFGDRRLWPNGIRGGAAYNRAIVAVFQFVYLNDAARTARCLREAADALRLPSWEALPRLEAIQATAGPIGTWRTSLSRLYLVNLTASPNCLLSTQAHHDAARVGLALELYRSANDDYPDGLDALVPDFLAEVSKDPFTGKDLFYIRAGDDVTVSSVGPDLKYNSGDDYIAWKTKRPPRRPRPSRRRRGKKRKAAEGGR